LLKKSSNFKRIVAYHFHYVFEGATVLRLNNFTNKAHTHIFNGKIISLIK